MNGNISNFMEEIKAPAEEVLYMEIKTGFNNTNPENITPASKTQLAKQTKEESCGSLPLGEEYERKKQKLQQELRLDYRRFVSEKKYSIADPPPQSHMLSLPIRDRKSAKKKLQDERNKEYKLFLKGQDGTQRAGKHSTAPQVLERDRFDSVTPKHAVSPEVQTQKGCKSPENVASSRRDAATITESVSGVHKGSRPRRHWLETADRLGRPHEHYRDHSSSEEEQVDLLEKKLRNIQKETDAARREEQPHNRTRSLQAPTPAQSRSVNEQNISVFATGLMIGAADGHEASRMRKEHYRQELLQQIDEQRKNKRKEKELELRVAATGIIDPEKQPRRIQQFGAVTQEYEGGRSEVPIRPPHAQEKRSPPERPRAAFQSPTLGNSTVLSRLANTSGPGLEFGAGLVNSIAPITEDYHRNLSSTLGEMVAPRATDGRPPMVPSASGSYQTPYDNVYYNYGARNPMDHNSNNYGAVVGQPSNIIPGAHWPVQQPPSLTQQSSPAGVLPSGASLLSPERQQKHRESALSYQKALKQQELQQFDRQGSYWNPLSSQAQIHDQQVRRHREKVEKELYDAKIEAEMKAFEPWGRAGGGAPLRDDQGNLISDLKQMHKTNMEAYDSGGRGASNQIALRTEPVGFPLPQPPLHARGNLFSEPSTPQQVHEQEKYKEYLRQQIEEKRRKEAEERECRRLEEEKEERRLAEQRATIQREYEEEQERKRQKEKEQNAKNEELIRQAEKHREEAEKKKREAEERENEALRKRLEDEQQTVLKEDQRAPSPPIPALQRKLRQQVPRPPTVESHRSAATLSVRSMSAPHSPPVPARRNEIRAKEEKKSVIRELSALRRQLRSEQRRLEGQLMQSDKNDNPSALPSRQRERPPEDVFEMARLGQQAPIRRPASHTTATVNMQNLQEFNHLKYRDSESREEVRQAYPETPIDDHSLDIQQQALLRQQQRTINNMRRARTTGYFDMLPLGQQHHEQRGSSAEDPGRHLLLDSESAFIDPSGDLLLLQSRRDQRAGQDSAHIRPAARRTDISDDMMSLYIRPDSGPDRQSVHSLSSAEIERLRERIKNKMTTLNNTREHDWTSEVTSAEEGEELWTQTPPPNGRHVSIDAFATEPWLRPSSSDTLKRFMGSRRPSSRNHTGQDWNGPSTYHG